MNLLDQLQAKINMLREQHFTDEDELEFFKFLSKQILTLKDLSSISNSDYLMALITLQKKDTFKTIYTAFLDLYMDLNVDTAQIEINITDFLQVIYFLKDINFLDELLQLNHVPCPNEVQVIIKKYNLKTNGPTSGKINSTQIASCVAKYKTVGLSVFDTFERVQSFARLVSKCENIDAETIKFFTVRNHLILYMMLEKRYEKAVLLRKNQSKLDEFEVACANEFMDITDTTLKQISDKYYELSRKKDQFTKGINKQILLYSQMMDIVKLISAEKPIDVKEDIFSRLDDSNLSLEFMKTLLEYRRKNYSILESENIKKDNYHQIEKLFLENRLYIEMLSENDRNILLRNGNVQVLKEIIELLKKNEFSWLTINHPNYVQIILNTSPIILQTIISLIRNEVISKEFVQHHVGILIDKAHIGINDNDMEACYDIFRRNISLLLKNTDYLALKLRKNEELAFMDTENLIASLELMKQYQLNLHSENAKMYGLNLLNNPENFDDLDQFIELGYTEYMKDNPQLLNEISKDIITRLSIVTNVGLNTMNKDNRLRGLITNGKNFYVPQENLNEYRIAMVDEYIENEDFVILKEQKRMVISPSTIELDIVEYLDNLFKVNDLEYRINDVIISRNKVLRNIECLIKYKEQYDDSSVALSAIIYHSVIDNNTIEVITEKLNEYKSQYVKKKTYNA